MSALDGSASRAEAHPPGLATAVRRLHLALPSSLDAPRRARQAARESLADLVTARELDDVLLLLSEVVADAVRRPRPQSSRVLEIHVAVAPQHIRAEVSDSSSGSEAGPRRSGSDVANGDLHLIDRLASRWGASSEITLCSWWEMDREPSR